MSKLIDFLESKMMTCQFKELTGHQCLGCGFQRAFILLLKGDFLASFFMYPALIPFIITITGVILQLIFKVEKGGSYIVFLFSISTIFAVGNFIIKKFF